MKNRFLSALLFIVLLFALTGCGAQQEMPAAAPAAQSAPIAASTPDCQHEWQDASCAAPSTCALCGETQGEKLPHTPGEEWVVAEEADYFRDGAETISCVNCGEVVESREIPQKTLRNEDTFAFRSYEYADILAYCLDSLELSSRCELGEMSMQNDGIREVYSIPLSIKDDNGNEVCSAFINFAALGDAKRFNYAGIALKKPTSENIELFLPFAEAFKMSIGADSISTEEMNSAVKNVGSGILEFNSNSEPLGRIGYKVEDFVKHLPNLDINKIRQNLGNGEISIDTEYIAANSSIPVEAITIATAQEGYLLIMIDFDTVLAETGNLPSWAPTHYLDRTSMDFVNEKYETDDLVWGVRSKVGYEHGAKKNNLALYVELPSVRAGSTPDDNKADGDQLHFETVDVYGNTWTEESFKDYKLVLINNWATWCGPCMREIPALEMLYQNYKDQGLLVIGINSNSDYWDEEAAAEGRLSLMRKYGLTYPLLAYTSDFDFLSMGVVPNTFFADSDGVLYTHEVDSATRNKYYSVPAQVVSECYPSSRSYEAWEAIVQQYLK